MNLPHYRCDNRQQHNAHNWPRSGVPDAYCAGRGEHMPEDFDPEETLHEGNQPKPSDVETRVDMGPPEPRGPWDVGGEWEEPLKPYDLVAEMDFPLDDPNAKALLKLATGDNEAELPKWEDPEVKQLMGAISADD